MTGYLTNVLRRTFDPTVAMVQPRLNGLFAPPQKSAVGPASSSTEPEWPWVEEQTGASGPAPALNDPPLRPFMRTTGLMPTEPTPSPPAPRSPGIHPNRRAPGYAEPLDVSQPVERGAAEVRLESEKPRRAPAAMQIAPGIKTSPSVVTAKPAREMMEIANREPSRRRREARAASLDRAQEDSPKPQASLTDQRPGGPGKSSGARVRAAARERSRLPDPIPPTEKGASKAQSLLVGLEPAAWRAGMRSVLPAFPVPSLEKHETKVSAESVSTQSTPAGALSGRGPLSIRPAHFREVTRRTPEPTETPEPTIEVTIGRIEVRGPAPAEPRRVPAKSSPGVSLDEYLRRRSGRSSE